MREHGGDIYTNEGLFDFSANINPLGPGRKVMEALKQSLADVTAYPDTKCRKLRAALAEKEHGKPEHIICGNGAADLIYTIVLAEKPKKALLYTPCFSEYEDALRTVGCEILCHERAEEENFALTRRYLDSLTEEVDMAFLCSPDNPTGMCVSEDLLADIVETCEQLRIRLVLDECFLDFTEDAPWIHHELWTGKYKMLFLLRAFTKMFAIPGIRIGYGICGDTELIKRMEGSRQAWPVSVPAQAAAEAALQDTLLVETTRQLIREERAHFEREFDKMGIRYYPSRANYIMFYSEVDFCEKMKEKGFLIRDCGNYRGLGKGYFRIAVKGREDNERLLRAFREILKEREGERKWQNQS